MIAATCCVSISPRPSEYAQRCPRSRELEHLAADAKALGDPTRLAIALAMRDGEQACVCDLAWIVGRDQGLVSHHARYLKAAGLASSRRDGKMVLYELTERGHDLLRTLAASVAADELPRAADGPV